MTMEIGVMKRFEVRRDDFETFDRREDRQRRGDDGVAVEQGRRGDAEQEHRCARAAEGALRQRHEGERSALAVVVGPQRG